MSKTSILGKDWILKNYNHETVKFLKDNYNFFAISKFLFNNDSPSRALKKLKKIIKGS